VAGDTIINFEGGEWNRLVTDEADFAATRRRLRGLEVRAVLCGHGPAIGDSAVLARLFERDR
jgi:glyoxylase-like metal-dependent hydrolase (beta-lactamase superfamily II)